MYCIDGVYPEQRVGLSTRDGHKIAVRPGGNIVWSSPHARQALRDQGLVSHRPVKTASGTWVTDAIDPDCVPMIHAALAGGWR